MFPSLLVPLLALMLSACKQEPVKSELRPGGYTLARFTDCGEMRAWVATAWTEALIQSRYGYGGYDLAAGGAEGDSTDGGSSGPSSYSETNNQEVGVDEPDLVKTDGSYLYVTHGSMLSVVKSWPANETAVLSTLDLDGEPLGLFLRGDRALVISTVWEYHDTGGATGGGETRPDSSDGGYGYGYYGLYGTGDVPDWAGDSDRYYGSSTRLSVVDLSDRSAPVVRREIDIEGYYTDARMIGSDVYLVSNAYGSMPESLWDLIWSGSLVLPEVTDWSDTAAIEEAAAEARAILFPRVYEAVATMSPEELLPEFRDQVPGADAAPTLLTQCSDVYHPDGYTNPSVLTVTHLDLDAGDAGSDLGATGLMSDGWQVYASQDRLYVAQAGWWWWWGWGDADLTTHIHAFSLDGADTTYLGSGKVAGYVQSRFNMSEYDGYLRVATTDASWWWGGGVAMAEDGTVDAGTSTGSAGSTGSATEGSDSSGASTALTVPDDTPANNVFVLQEGATGLEQVGALSGIAPGEQIYAARFLGDKGYLVTFLQTDPLFTLDLSDPSNPRQVGELEVPGYSTYLHPTDADHLLAVGMGDSDGGTSRFQVSLFDVSDMAAPVLDDRFEVSSDDWSWSDSLWDPHAFTYFADTLSVPIYTYNYDSSTGSYSDFSGLLVLDVDLAGGALTELGTVGHGDLAADSTCPADPYDDCYDYGDYAWMRRSVVIEDWLYSLSSYGIKVTSLRDPTTMAARVLWYPSK